MKPILCHVDYVDGLPVGVHEIKTFETQQEYDAFIKTCLSNREKLYGKELEAKCKEQADKARKEKVDDLFLQIIAYNVYEHLASAGKINPYQNDDELFDHICKGDWEYISNCKEYVKLLNLLRGATQL